MLKRRAWSIRRAKSRRAAQRLLPLFLHMKCPLSLEPAWQSAKRLKLSLRMSLARSASATCSDAEN
eukprot:10357568-Alexandrium_andersonii.AAC.1